MTSPDEVSRQVWEVGGRALVARVGCRGTGGMSAENSPRLGNGFLAGWMSRQIWEVGGRALMAQAVEGQGYKCREPSTSGSGLLAGWIHGLVEG